MSENPAPDSDAIESFLAQSDTSRRIRLLEDLVRHAQVHSSYRDCGFMQMTTEQKIVYCTLVGDTLGNRLAAHAEAEKKHKRNHAGGAARILGYPDVDASALDAGKEGL